MVQTALRPDLAYLNATNNLPALAGVAVKMAVVLTQWSTRQRTRRALDHLDPHLLRDIGLSPDAARDELSHHFWEGLATRRPYH
ncbi:DUF1127 domain-containing protein [Pelagimonas varians]|uniref:DUF1127 domain-containing protein n=1 Tax=Pelagimonas varians TaxID=696760 RepID=UPI000BEF196B|nr:DUF1127 domain-containing protein [Pelagimonas varians]